MVFRTEDKQCDANVSAFFICAKSPLPVAVLHFCSFGVCMA